VGYEATQYGSVLRRFVWEWFKRQLFRSMVDPPRWEAYRHFILSCCKEKRCGVDYLHDVDLQASSNLELEL